MKREFLKGIEGLSDEAISKIMEENGKDIEREKTKAADLSAKIEGLNSKISTYETKISELESTSGDAEKYKKELEKLQTTIADEKAATEKEKADKELTEAITAVFGEKKFTSEYVQKGIVEDMKAEIAKPENKGKGYAELFESLTKDKEGIFAPESQVSGTPGIKGNASTKTVDENRAREIMGLPPLKD